MILDEIDLKILREFCKLKDNEFTSTWIIMKKIYKNGRDLENSKIKRRIKKMSNHGLFEVEGNPEVYTLISDNVIHKKIKFDNKFVESICFFDDGKWSAFEI